MNRRNLISGGLFGLLALCGWKRGESAPAYTVMPPIIQTWTERVPRIGAPWPPEFDGHLFCCSVTLADGSKTTLRSRDGGRLKPWLDGVLSINEARKAKQ